MEDLSLTCEAKHSTDVILLLCENLGQAIHTHVCSTSWNSEQSVIRLQHDTYRPTTVSSLWPVWTVQSLTTSCERSVLRRQRVLYATILHCYLHLHLPAYSAVLLLLITIIIIINIIIMAHQYKAAGIKIDKELSCRTGMV